MNDFTWENILYRYANRSKEIFKFDLYKYTSFNSYENKVIHQQFLGYKKDNNYPPGEKYSKLMLTIYKPWIKIFDDFLDKSYAFSINKKIYFQVMCVIICQMKKNYFRKKTHSNYSNIHSL